jgi:hypothetical protein
VLQTKPSLCWYIEQLAASFQLSSTNHQHPLARRSERMLAAWSARILQVCHGAEAVALDDVVELAVCWS